ncbi:hypothetical protein QUB80_00545 [Chlorogloeopsis sp. ULAP01]|uniref:hypothetical protein n=1 Tax=Chlorogloeopsis sp. ULAP01 TaxID=3056483 RepID=UPI0025AB1B82|nr:hypothetical protein [Chlorogloeopsis sp. ULAP01]MDM9379197.1 hypothetical protein [Chlorogloeopsis sp. ULAP01]
MKTLNKYQKGGWNNRIGALAIALAAIVLPACANNQQQATTPQSPAAEAPNTSEPVAETAPGVSERTEALMGQLVTVRSQPINRVDDRVFTITDEQVFSGERIVVVNNTGQPVQVPEVESARLQVTGTVTKFDPNAIRQKYGLDLGQDSYREYEGRPTIIARSIALAPIPGEIGENPQAYYNKVIAVPAEVERIYSPNAFVLEDKTLLGDNPLLVLVTEQVKDKVPIKEGERIVATGTLRPFIASELERDYKFAWNQQLRGQLENEYKTRPVLIVEGIYSSPQSTN